jgi:hypothetical protein
MSVASVSKVPRVVARALTEVDGIKAFVSPETPTTTAAAFASLFTVVTFRMQSTICEFAGIVATVVVAEAPIISITAD